MFVCLFVYLEFIVPLENFSLIWRRKHCRWRAEILIFARHSWPLSGEGSLTFHTFCNTGLPLIIVTSDDPWHTNLLPSVWQWICHYLFLWLRFIATGNRASISRIPEQYIKQNTCTYASKQNYGSILLPPICKINFVNM